MPVVPYLRKGRSLFEKTRVVFKLSLKARNKQTFVILDLEFAGSPKTHPGQPADAKWQGTCHSHEYFPSPMKFIRFSNSCATNFHISRRTSAQKHVDDHILIKNLSPISRGSSRQGTLF